ncbi:MAG: radical SAM protein [Candidatus Omnitrophota bacterium]|nr:radical SAM protein [Candidatus Omnitrophota bacterium]MBU1929278.1 radical SAM protein [Candidatus Omnitrophota bacterium]MBU2035572.1 radical SAM protein [Candidatus Omnitrophota bacterium]MBU2257817.1 radical SAM protein [Candidatus Omnitrophota bacterium]
MCYAIPGRITGIKDNIVSVEYFGEQKKARNEFFDLKIGDYAYAQGGFIIQKISEREALPVLESWKELFFKLQEIDSQLIQKDPKTLYQRANNLRQKYHGNSCCTHGIIEFSNYCGMDCFYCGIRKSNSKLARYRMSLDEILEAARFAVHKLRFKALVLQSGEDPWYDEEKLVYLVKKIRQDSPSLIILSLGERDFGLYERLYKEGARSVLLRFETANLDLYAQLRPGRELKNRVELIGKLHKLGYLVMTGFLIGLPGEKEEDIKKNIELTNALAADMFSFGPFIPHPDTPLANTPLVHTETVLNTIANARVLNPKAQILVNTSFETLDRANALRSGLMAGANSLMINVTPRKYQRFYDIYPERAGVEEDVEMRIENIVKLLRSIGRAPTDLGL